MYSLIVVCGRFFIAFKGVDDLKEMYDLLCELIKRIESDDEVCFMEDNYMEVIKQKADTLIKTKMTRII